MTITEIASLSGVSVATVSRVLNHPDAVLPETREHILRIMEENNYSPSWCARGLRLGNPGMIVLLVPSIEHTFSQMVVSGVETITATKQHTLVLCVTNDEKAREQEYLNRMIDRKADGFILVNSTLSGSELSVLKARNIPCVHIGMRQDDAFRHLCYIDHTDGVYGLMQHLVDLGHRKMTFILNAHSKIFTSQIQTGAKLAVQGRTDDPIEIRYLLTENSVSGGFNGLKQLIDENDLPDVIVAGTAEMAMGVVQSAQFNRMRIPDDVALVSLADAPVCSVLSPQITAISQPVKRLGMMAARMLFDVLEDIDVAEGLPQEITLKTKLKIRRSCGNTKLIYDPME